MKMVKDDKIVRNDGELTIEEMVADVMSELKQGNKKNQKKNHKNEI